MPSLALALQRFSDLIPRLPGDPAKARPALPGDRLCKCLERDLIPALTPLWASPSFQRLALWPIVTWLPSCDTPQRLLITQLKQAITECAEAIPGFAGEHAALLNDHFPDAVRRWHKVKGYSHTGAPAPSVDDALLTLKRVMVLCQEEWASAEDYFRPRFNVFFQGEGSQWHQRGEFIIGYNPDLQHVGNIIARCLLVRAGTAIHLLEETTKEFEVTLIAGQSRVKQPWHAQQARIRQLFEDLRNACLHAQDAIRAEAAMSMVQIAVEFSRRRPDLGWLPPEATESIATSGVRLALEGQRDLPTALIIREAMATIEKWSTGRTTADSAIEDAIATGNLVVVEGSREVYWKGNRLDADWDAQNQPWQLLLMLARTRGRNFVSADDLFGDEEKSGSALPRIKNRLKNMLPADLNALIIPVSTPNSGYRLDLHPQSIHFFPA